MANLFDYLAWRGDLTLSAAPLNAVDGLILSRLSYLPFETALPKPGEGLVSIADAAARLAKDDTVVYLLKDDARLLAALADCARFQEMQLSHYVNQVDLEDEKQFSAIVITLGDGAIFVSYRGTDYSLVGWKEDFNLSFMETVPSQEAARIYLNEIAAALEGPIYVGGHSKGGNLAVYAAAFCEDAVRERLVTIYSNDAPGFHDSLLDSAGYRALHDRIVNLVPQSSIVGMLMGHAGDYTVVQSKQVGILQHDLFSWQVMRDDVVRLNTVDRSSQIVNRAVSEWLDAMSMEQREKLSDAMYEILCATGAETMTQIPAAWLKNAHAVSQTMKTIDEPTRKLLPELFRLLAQAAGDAILPWRSETENSRKSLT